MDRVLPLVPAARTPVDGAAVDGAAVDGAAVDGAACCAPLMQAALSAEQAEGLARTLKAVAEPSRLRLLSLLADTSAGPVCVCDLTEPLGLSQPTVSHHLRVLTEAGLLSRSKRGTWAYYAVVPEALAAVAAVLAPGERR